MGTLFTPFKSSIAHINFPCSCIFVIFFSFTLSTSSWQTMYSQVDAQISEPLQYPSLLLWVVFMPYFPVVYVVTGDNKPIWVELSWKYESGYFWPNRKKPEEATRNQTRPDHTYYHCVRHALNLNPLSAKFFRGNIKHIFTFDVIPQHCDDIGGWNPSSNKTRKDLPILHSQYHGCWCPGDAWSQDINSYDIDLVKPR